MRLGRRVGSVSSLPWALWETLLLPLPDKYKGSAQSGRRQVTIRVARWEEDSMAEDTCKVLVTPCDGLSSLAWRSSSEGRSVLKHRTQWDPLSFATSCSRLNRAVWFSWQIRLAGASVPSSKRMPLFFVGVSPVLTMLLISFSLWRGVGGKSRIISHYCDYQNIKWTFVNCITMGLRVLYLWRSVLYLFNRHTGLSITRVC